jgi:hypothetical protein
MNIEEQLKDALRREPPPAGFADRVMARIANDTRVVPLQRRLPVWRAVAAAALLVLVGLGAVIEHAKRQALLAMQITSAKVAHAQREVLREK